MALCLFEPRAIGHGIIGSMGCHSQVKSRALPQCAVLGTGREIQMGELVLSEIEDACCGSSRADKGKQLTSNTTVL